jgi:hypothetical protein
MKPFRQPGILTRVTAMLCILAYLSGCTTWRAQPLEPERFPAGKQRGAIVRVALADGRRIAVADPWIEHDSLLWSHSGVADSLNRTGVRLADVTAAKVQSVDAGRTTLLVTAIGVTVATVVAVAALKNYRWNCPTGSCCFIGCE